MTKLVEKHGAHAERVTEQNVDTPKIHNIFVQWKDQYKKRIVKQHSNVHTYLEKAGFSITAKDAFLRLFHICIVLTFLTTAALVYSFSIRAQYTLVYLGLLSIFLLTAVFIVLWFFLTLLFFFYIDLRIHNRKKSIEEVLPEFLQLTAANIRAGMSIDRAMWFAMRPKFGVFAKEIEDIAKSTYSGEDFNEALLTFAKKYDSQIVSRSFHLLVEGITAGGEIANLLNKISEDITEVKILKRDMAASVTTYIIFISVATLIAAPILFSLSTQLLGIVTGLSSTLDVGNSAAVGSFGFSVGGTSLTPSDFRIFSLAALGVTSFFAACIVAIIKRGSVKNGIRYIPFFVLVSLSFYLVLNLLLNGIFSTIVVF